MRWLVGGGTAAVVAAAGSVVIVHSLLAKNNAPLPPALSAPTLGAAPCTPPPVPCTTTSTTATFGFQLSSPAAFASAAQPIRRVRRFRCALDEATPASCTSPITFSDLGTGAHRFSVAALAERGAGPPLVFRWRIVPPPPGAEPDLVVAELRGDGLVVQNLGQAEAGPSVVRVKGVGRFGVDALQPGTSETVRFPTCVTLGLTAIADVKNQVEESNEDNNTTRIGRFECSRPDLVVGELRSTWVTVQNSGGGVSGPTTVVVQGVTSFDVPSLQPKETFSDNFDTCQRQQLTATVDPADGVKESDEGNNTLSNGPFTTCPLADLVVASLTQNSVTVANQGEGAAGPSLVALNDVGSLSVHSLLTGESDTITFETCHEGSLTATADSVNDVKESNEDNNELTQGPFTCPLSDLVVSALSGGSLSVTNVGEGPAGPSDATVDDITLPIGPLEPGQTDTATFACQETVLVATADAGLDVRESDETNNARRGGPFTCPRPDLVVSDLTDQGATVQNIGQTAAGPSLLLVGGAQGSRVFPIGALEAGQTANVSFSCVPGSLRALADAKRQVSESNEDNNTRTAGPFECAPPTSSAPPID